MDDAKAASNERKHRVSFKEAANVFCDPYARVIEDPDHSIEEERFIILGLSHKTRELIVSHCYRNNDEIIRIISARKATKAETNQYWRFIHAD